MATGKYQEWLEPDGLLRLEAWARDGLTDEQIAANIGICRDTLYEWKRSFPSISDALKRGKAVVDIEVENALYKRAIGYDFQEEKIEVRGKQRIVTQTLKHIPPDVTAQIFWLKNRKPDEWRDKVQTELTGKDGGPIEIDSPLQRIERRIAGLASRLGTVKDTERSDAGGSDTP